jgi:hypothetical protein
VVVIAAIENEYHQGSTNYPLPLSYAPIRYQMIGIRLLGDLDEPMVSVMAIGSEVFGRCVGGIDVSVGRCCQVSDAVF